nr:MAG TPA: hypothetical protein [Caudoviricetes sp.]DAS10247.1 MAG TPA: hypothetical protein [Caudoviricetes sp.]DAZ37204.1 MAG TPA: hypothetical protein [Caudoviricetes sp.]
MLYSGFRSRFECISLPFSICPKCCLTPPDFLVKNGCRTFRRGSP